MTEAERLADIIGIRLTSEEIFAAAILEREGLKFCVDFGWVNCVEKAAAIKPKDIA